MVQSMHYAGTRRVRNTDAHPRREKRHGELLKESWELFRECQHMQPDVDQIRDYIDEKFGQDVTSQIGLYRPTPTQRAWAPKQTIESLWSCRPSRKGDKRGNLALEIEAKGLQVRSNILRSQPGNQTEENLKNYRPWGSNLREATRNSIWTMS